MLLEFDWPLRFADVEKTEIGIPRVKYTLRIKTAKIDQCLVYLYLKLTEKFPDFCLLFFLLPALPKMKHFQKDFVKFYNMLPYY